MCLGLRLVVADLLWLLHIERAKGFGTMCLVVAPGNRQQRELFGKMSVLGQNVWDFRRLILASTTSGMLDPTSSSIISSLHVLREYIRQ